MKDNEIELNKAHTVNDLAKKIVGKLLLSSLPVAGVLLSTLWDETATYTLTRRRKEWESSLEERLQKVEKTVEAVVSDDLFVTALLTTTPIAIKTGDSRKREYLANVVANTINDKIDESKLIVFLNLLDKYTVWHITFLQYFKDLADEGEILQEYKNSSSVWVNVTFSKLLSLRFPQLTNEQDFVEKLLRDLETDGLLFRSSVFGFITKDNVGGHRVTKLGEDFLNFVSIQN